MSTSYVYELKDSHGLRIAYGSSFMSAYQKVNTNPDCKVIEKVEVENSNKKASSVAWKNNHFDCYV